MPISRIPPDVFFLDRASGRSLPARAHWEIDPDGPLAYLRAARQLASVRIRDFRIDFG